MPDAGTIDALAGIDVDALRDWVEEQRWYASKSRHVTSVELVEAAIVRDAPPQLVIALLQTGFATGTHELYQLPVGLRPAGEDGPGAITDTDAWTIYDALSEPEHGRELMRQIDAQTEIATAEGQFSFHRANGVLDLGENADVRPMGVEQSNSSLVFGEQLVLKVFRKVEPGLNPELEMLRFLTARGFPNIAPLYGWCEYQGDALAATLLVAQRFLPDGTGGWELALDEIATDPEAFLERLGSLGQVTAQMHTVLSSDASDPAFVPEEPSEESLSLLTATLDEDIDRLFSRLPDDERLDPIRGRGQDVQERLSVLSQIGTGGKLMRNHGDYHLGQTLVTPRGWVILDFEGEPARPLHERRQKRSPLRDVAGMLRSFAYVASAAEMQRGTPVPEGWEERARGAFLDHYLEAVEPNLLPPGEAAVANLLSVFELEKAVYELRYELDNRPDWVPIPVAGIERILGQT
ncbi:MAG: maltokinase [Thermoleophilaceae bacterium]|jgi:trehalose synthase-fused probable maltokinase|nr:maltokinase [Thermoleophilaceae bacterium]